jgi:hypothetical protein
MMERDHRIGLFDAEDTRASFRALGYGAKQHGVALAIVVWFIAGMSLLVVGIVSHVRVDTQMAQVHVARAKAVAAGDGAIQLMLADRLLNVDPATGEPGRLTGKYQLGNNEVTVTLYPATDFINIDSAPQKVLAALFLLEGQVSEGEANSLADNVVKWRGGLSGSDSAQSRINTFAAIEDLLRVEGMHRTLFDAIRDFIVVGQGGGVTYRADAVVRYGDQEWLRRRWVALGSGAGSSLPWHFSRTEPPRVHEQTNGVH